MLLGHYLQVLLPSTFFPLPPLILVILLVFFFGAHSLGRESFHLRVKSVLEKLELATFKYLQFGKTVFSQMSGNQAETDFHFFPRLKNKKSSAKKVTRSL